MDTVQPSKARCCSAVRQARVLDGSLRCYPGEPYFIGYCMSRDVSHVSGKHAYSPHVDLHIKRSWARTSILLLSFIHIPWVEFPPCPLFHLRS